MSLFYPCAFLYELFVLLLSRLKRIPLIISFSVSFIAWVWQQQSEPTLPLLSTFVVQQGLVYGLPIIVWQDSVSNYPESLLLSATGTFTLWILALGLGWRLTSSKWLSLQPQPLLQLDGSLNDKLPYQLLLINLLLELFLKTDLLWTIFGSTAPGLLGILRAMGGALVVIGGFLGGYQHGLNKLHHPRLFWLIWILILLYKISSLLLSASSNLILATLMGLWLAKPRRAIPITLILLTLISFLNQSKFVLRERYWNTGVSINNPVALVQEWVTESIRFSGKSGETDQEEKQPFYDRVNNLQNLLFIINKLELDKFPLIEGASYEPIPQLLIPRIFSSDKVRSQEGQVILNLSFGRQSNRLATEATYIAWGFLPEAIANFGLLPGSLGIGIVIGILLRLCENLCRNQQFLTMPGIISLGLFVLWITSYEMVASTFIAGAYQLILVVILGCWIFNRFNRQPILRSPSHTDK